MLLIASYGMTCTESISYIITYVAGTVYKQRYVYTAAYVRMLQLCTTYKANFTFCIYVPTLVGDLNIDGKYYITIVFASPVIA